jgi:RNA polymerase sigma-70 factor, ECF subfamily
MPLQLRTTRKPRKRLWDKLGGEERMTSGKATSQESEHALLAGLKRGDENAFRQLVAAHQKSMLSFARTFLRDPGAAEEAVQDTWLALISGISEFEGRSSLKSWIFAILANVARTKARKNGRTVTFTDMGYNDPAVDTDRFSGDGTWLSPPGQWYAITPERILGGKQLLIHVLAILETLPPAQRAVVTLRDLEGLAPEEACSILEITEANQRILLHRGRSRVRLELERLLADPSQRSP